MTATKYCFTEKLHSPPLLEHFPFKMEAGQNLQSGMTVPMRLSEQTEQRCIRAYQPVGSRSFMHISGIQIGIF